MSNPHHINYYLAIHNSVKPFKLVNDDARNTEASFSSAVKGSKRLLRNKILYVLTFEKWTSACDWPIQHKFREFLKQDINDGSL